LELWSNNINYFTDINYSKAVAASILLLADRPCEAIDILQNLSSPPEYHDAVDYLLSKAYESFNKSSDAIVAIIAAVNKRPGSALYRVKYAEKLLKKGSYNEAVEQYRIATTLVPSESVFHSLIGKILEFKLKDFDSAEQEYTKAIELDGDMLDIDNNALLARILENRHKFKELSNHCEKYGNFEEYYLEEELTKTDNGNYNILKYLRNTCNQAKRKSRILFRKE